jgi:type IV secretory pathway VirB2 component (pilin)
MITKIAGAAMGHFAIIIAIWGMLALGGLILQGKRGLFLRFQSIQTLGLVFVTSCF